MTRPRFTDVTKPLAGFLDSAGRDVRIIRFLQATFTDLFSRWGYEEIMVPIVERASSFSEEVIGGSPWPEWDKRGVFYVQLPSYDRSYTELPNQEPALLVPEGTISVSRWLADAYSQGGLSTPRKIFYVMPCFRNELLSKLSPTKGRQFHQAGIEVLGTGNVRADLEVLLISYAGFVQIGVDPSSILVRMGSVELFNAICMETGISESDVLTVKDLMDTIAEARAGKQPERLEPSIQRVLGIVATYQPSSMIIAKWKNMTNTFVDELDAEFLNAIGHAAMIRDLNFLAASARSQGLRCIIDPSVVRSHEYYTGIVYEMDIQVPGEPPLVEVAGGGRYNKLIGKFLDTSQQDVTIPAVGFAYGLERVAAIFQMIGVSETQRRVSLRTEHHLGVSIVDKVLVESTNGYDPELWRRAGALRDEGNRVDVYVGDDQSDSHIEQYASQLGAELVRLHVADAVE